MAQESNKGETVAKSVEKIHTKLKFIKSERNGALISFVSQNPHNGIVCGVREDSPYPKKIVIIDKELAHSILVNMLYDCVLIPMTPTQSKNGEEFIPGYIAIEATPVQFKAKVITKYTKGTTYIVEVSFGNKVIRFDPFHGVKESVKSLPACRAVLEKRCDVLNLMDVIEDFEHAALNILQLMKDDKRQRYNNKPYAKTNRGNRH